MFKCAITGANGVLGKKISVAEIEEVCIANSTLSFQDYLECRKMNLVIQIFFNDGVFEEILFLLRKPKIYKVVDSNFAIRQIGLIFGGLLMNICLLNSVGRTNWTSFIKKQESC